MKFFHFLFFSFFSTFILQAQNYDDYLGGGHDENISVTTSSDFHLDGWTQAASGDKTIAVSGLDGKLFDAARFLAQATMGADKNTIESVAKMDFEDWIDQQFLQPPTLIQPLIPEIFDTTYQRYLAAGGDTLEYAEIPTNEHFDYAWWQVNMTSQDLLRQRMAFALSEIFVVSFDSRLDHFGEGVANYYDNFIENAFGNFKDILTNVSLHPVMGYFLTHLNNPKSDPAHFIHPDENYAREIMQLFTIGLYELNLDGTRKTDADGHDIPTYDNDDIKEFAKIFTGLGGGATVPQPDTILEPAFGRGLSVIDMTVPMVMYDDYHEQGVKHLLNGFTVPAGQTGMEDVTMAIDHLFNHPNVGPFIANLLIQRFVKSNPTPAYVARVASAFNDNGSGVRGDMKAVIKAILLDEEARTCGWQTDPTQGKLKEPIIRYTHFARAIGGISADGKYWNFGYDYNDDAGQHPMYSPTVFNFYWSDFTPLGPIADQGLVAPEFQVYNSRTSIGFVNFVNDWAVEENLLWTTGEPEVIVKTDYGELLEYAKDTEVLINKLDVLLTNGLLKEDTRQIIKNAVEPLEDLTEKLRLTTYLMVISADYNILK